MKIESENNAVSGIWRACASAAALRASRLALRLCVAKISKRENNGVIENNGNENENESINRNNGVEAKI
jgi:hypothetical protein